MRVRGKPSIPVFGFIICLLLISGFSAARPPEPDEAGDQRSRAREELSGQMDDPELLYAIGTGINENRESSIEEATQAAHRDILRNSQLNIEEFLSLAFTQKNLEISEKLDIASNNNEALIGSFKVINTKLLNDQGEFFCLRLVAIRKNRIDKLIYQIVKEDPDIYNVIFDTEAFKQLEYSIQQEDQ